MTPENVARLNDEIAGFSPAKIIRRTFQEAARAAKPQKPIIGSSFGPNSAVLLHRVLSLYPDTEVVLANYGNVPATNWDYAAELSMQLGFVLRPFEPETPLSKYERSVFEHGSEKERLVLAGRRKLEAMLCALAALETSFVFYGVRHPQNRGWEAMNPLMLHQKGFLCIYPSWKTTHTEAATYLEKNGLPKHPAGLPGDRKETCLLHPGRERVA